MSITLISVILCFFTSNFDVKKHDFHISLTEVNYNSKTDVLELSVRVFIDDFERVLTTQNNEKKVTISEAENAVTDQHIEKYLRKHLAFISPDKQVNQLQYLGKEIERDAVWLYVEVPNASKMANYSVYNVLFLEHFDDQTNLMNFLLPNLKKTLVFSQKTKLLPYPA
jgi:hypothetical protein